MHISVYAYEQTPILYGEIFFFLKTFDYPPFEVLNVRFLALGFSPRERCLFQRCLF